MRLLVDTHIALWAIRNSPEFPEKARALLADGGNDAYLSKASIWEVSIKHAARPDRMRFGALDFARICSASGFSLLPIEVRHIAAAEGFAYDHKDPFDRLIYGQAVAENLTLVTHDKNIALLGESNLLVV